MMTWIKHKTRLESKTRIKCGKMKKHNVDDEQFRSGDGGSNDHTIGLNYFNSLTHDQKRNIIATYGYSDKNDRVVHIKPEDVDTTGLEFDDLDKWAKKGIIDMAKNRLSKNRTICKT